MSNRHGLNYPDTVAPDIAKSIKEHVCNRSEFVAILPRVIALVEKNHQPCCGVLKKHIVISTMRHLARHRISDSYKDWVDVFINETLSSLIDEIVTLCNIDLGQKMEAVNEVAKNKHDVKHDVKIEVNEGSCLTIKVV